MRVTAQQGDTVDLLCWRHYGVTQGMVELVLEQNPGLADYGMTLPHGLEVEMPEAPKQKTQSPLLQLWD
jgi:phage tail protein X